MVAKPEGLRVAIAGAGIGGLALARSLQCKGIGKVTIFERAPALRARGGHIAVTSLTHNKPGQPGALTFLEELGLGDLVWGCCLETTALRHVSDGKTLIEYPLPEGVKVARITRESLVEILAESLDEATTTLRFGCPVVGFVEKPNCVQVMLKDGSSEEFDVLVGADGIHSAISSQLFPDAAKPFYAGFVTYVCLAPKITMPDPHCYQEYFGETHNGVGARVTAIAGGGRSGNWDLISVTVRESETVTNEWDNTTTALETRKLLEGMGTAVPSWTLDIVDRSEKVWKWGMFEHAQKKTWLSEGGRVALLGDAAHAMVPYLGQGANSALLDAMVISNELAKAASPDADSVRAALLAYESARKATCELAQEDSRHHGMVMTATGLAARLRDWTFKLNLLGQKCRYSPQSLVCWVGTVIQGVIAWTISTADTGSLVAELGTTN